MYDLFCDCFNPAAVNLCRFLLLAVPLVARLGSRMWFGRVETNNSNRVAVNNNDDDSNETSGGSDAEITTGDSDRLSLWPRAASTVSAVAHVLNIPGCCRLWFRAGLSRWVRHPGLRRRSYGAYRRGGGPPDTPCARI